MTPACREVLVGPHEIRAPRACVEPLCEEIVIIDKVIADDENPGALRWLNSVRHMQDRLLTANRIKQPDRPPIAVAHGSVRKWGTEARRACPGVRIRSR